MNIIPAFLSYTSAFGRLGALRSKGLSPRVIEDLVETTDLKTCISVLRQTPMVSEALGQAASLQEIEHAVRDGYLGYGARLLRFVQGSPAEFFHCLLAEADLWNAKLLLRRCFFPEEFTNDLCGKLWYKKRLVTSLEIGADEPTVQGGISVWQDRFRASWLGKLLSLELLASETEGFHAIEASLDAQFNRAVWQSAGELGMMDRRHIRNRMLAPYFGSMELAWALRLRFSYDQTPTKLLSEFYVLRQWLGQQSCVELFRLESLDHALERLWQMDSFPRSLREQDRPEFVSDLEIMLRRWAWSCVSHSGAGTPVSARGITSFLLAQRILVDDVITVLQAKQYGLQREETSRQLASISNDAVSSA